MKGKRRLVSFRCAFRGIGQMLCEEPNMRIQFVAAFLVTGISLWLRLDAVRFISLLLAIGLVLVAEGLNTSLEHLASLASKGYSEEARLAKDIAGGTVLLAVFVALVLGIIVLGPPLYERLITLR